MINTRFKIVGPLQLPHGAPKEVSLPSLLRSGDTIRHRTGGDSVAVYRVMQVILVLDEREGSTAQEIELEVESATS